MEVHPLKVFRQSRGLSQGQLADLLRVKRETVSRWESGARKIDGEKLRLVSEATGIAPSELRPDLAELLRGQ